MTPELRTAQLEDVPVLQKNSTRLLLLIAAVAVAALFFVGPIAQDPTYHRFADTGTLAGIDNFWNVASNLPFLIVGALGLWRFPKLAQRETAACYSVLCAGVVLVALGSAYYHAAPGNGRLLWDRLPMTLTFMALFAMLLGERVFRGPRPYFLWLLVAGGIGAAVYWSWSEAQGRGDLRPYVLVQFLPLVLMPLILWWFPRRYLNDAMFWMALGLYVVAKVFEIFDAEIFAVTGVLGGHALKHVIAAVAVLCIVYAAPTRRPRA